MYKNKLIAVVVPCFNEAKQIGKVVNTMPNYMDHIIIIDDNSTDETNSVIKKLSISDQRIHLITHEKNQGVGGAIASGYKWARDNNIDITVVMAGDAQMEPSQMPKLLDPIVADAFDYTKGNRLKYPNAYHIIPKVRFFGNQILSFFTKIASGYWRISDAQNGYTAINLRALQAIDWDKMYKRYGQPNDLLVKLNIANMRVTDCIMAPIYGVGEESKMKISRVFTTLPILLFKLFLKRIFVKYVIQDFSLIAPLFYLGIFNLALFCIFFARTLILYASNSFPEISFIISLYSLQMGIFLVLIGMYFDMQANEKLQTDILPTNEFR
ncbi:glycosyltransferase family 2 protein [Candidatus Tisiphia endosymbiont of Nemotelus uliginosus]|uniref:glycosyltransferase family 2 protein n=1 Tax=Candidatus Tisiphia endosymbiont of Nemotelus uliginosus TaxID=3077926 RepID=UPI0035C8D9FB